MIDILAQTRVSTIPPTQRYGIQDSAGTGGTKNAAGVHKSSPALVEQLRAMLQELLHNGLIVPSNSLPVLNMQYLF